jgi:hypothetical protein
MKSDAEIRDDVINELHWDPQVTKPEAIGVAVKDGAVALTGHVPSYAEKLAAARAAERVYGVKAVANDLKVQLSRAPRDDSDIARAIASWVERADSGRCTPGWRTAGSRSTARWTTTTRSARSGRSTTSAGWPGCELHHRPAVEPPRRPSGAAAFRRDRPPAQVG